MPRKNNTLTKSNKDLAKNMPTKPPGPIENIKGRNHKSPNRSILVKRKKAESINYRNSPNYSISHVSLKKPF